MTSRRWPWLALTALIALALALVLGRVMWQPTLVPVRAVDMTAPPVKRRAFDSAPTPTAPLDDAPRATLPVEALSPDEARSDELMERAAWIGGGVVACDVSDVLPEPDLLLTVGAPDHIAADYPIDIVSWDRGLAPESLGFVVNTPDGQVDVLVAHRHEAGQERVLEVRWRGANPDAPVGCQVAAVHTASPVEIEMHDPEVGEDNLPYKSLVLGCGRGHFADDRGQPVRATLPVHKPCTVRSVRISPLSVDYGPPTLLTPDSGHVVIEPPPPGHRVDLAMAWIFADALAYKGSDALERQLLDLIHRASQPGGAEDAVQYLHSWVAAQQAEAPTDDVDLPDAGPDE